MIYLFYPLLKPVPYNLLIIVIPHRKYLYSITPPRYKRVLKRALGLYYTTY